LDKNAPIFVAGHRGLVGTALIAKLSEAGFANLILRTRTETDLRDQAAVNSLFAETRPQYVFLAAAKVGGIYANLTYPAEFIYDNLMIQSNILQAAYQYRVAKLLFLGSCCVYPRLAPQPLREEYLLTGLLEPINEAYAVAKICGIKMCQAYNRQYGTNFIAVQPANLYGPHDHFDSKNSHVLAALIVKMHQAKVLNLSSITLWGNGLALREFLYIGDLAEACLFLMKNYNDNEIINIGFGDDITIKDLAGLIQKIIGYTGVIDWDAEMPEGTPRKLLDISKISSLGWKAKMPLEAGIRLTYQWFLDHGPGLGTDAVWKKEE
jgi:GDP-L-fucose synthase